MRGALSQGSTNALTCLSNRSRMLSFQKTMTLHHYPVNDPSQARRNLRAPSLTSCLAPSDLSPYILIHHIPCPPHVNTTDRDEKFCIIFERFAYLISREHFRRVSCFKREEDSSPPQWLVISEFSELPTSHWWLTLKKQEAEYWWRKNGWERVLIEFFRLRQPG